MKAKRNTGYTTTTKFTCFVLFFLHKGSYLFQPWTAKWFQVVVGGCSPRGTGRNALFSSLQAGGAAGPEEEEEEPPYCVYPP